MQSNCSEPTLHIVNPFVVAQHRWEIQHGAAVRMTAAVPIAKKRYVSDACVWPHAIMRRNSHWSGVLAG